MPCIQTLTSIKCPMVDTIECIEKEDNFEDERLMNCKVMLDLWDEDSTLIENIVEISAGNVWSTDMFSPPYHEKQGGELITKIKFNSHTECHTEPNDRWGEGHAHKTLLCQRMR